MHSDIEQRARELLATLPGPVDPDDWSTCYADGWNDCLRLTQDELMPVLVAALASQPQAPAAAVPDGFVLVPREPTQAMRTSGNKAIQACNTEAGMNLADRAFYCYRAMIVAAQEREG